MDDLPFDLVIANARLRERPEGLWQIGVRGDTVAAMSLDTLAGDQTIDAEENLVSVPFADAHMHLCKAYTLSMVGEEALRRYSDAGMGDAMTAVELAASVKERYAEGWIFKNARRALLEGLRHGVTSVRAFADTDTSAGLEGVKPLLRLRDEFADVMDVQVVAFPQDGLIRDPGAIDVVAAALDLGADVVGGIPWIEFTDHDARRHVEMVMDLAVRFDRDVAMLTDDAGDPSLRTTEMLAAAALEHGWERRVTACHARALGVYPQPTLRRLLGLANRVGMSFVSNPHTGPLRLPIAEVIAEGIPVALAQDDIEDAYYPYGRHNLLEVAFLASHVLHRYTTADMDMFFAMITGHGRRAMGLPAQRIAEGAPADLVVLDGATVHEALTRHAAPRIVLRAGRIVATTTSATTFPCLS